MCRIYARDDSVVYISQFARVVKGVDLRSTAGACTWVRIPQLAYGFDAIFIEETCPQ